MLLAPLLSGIVLGAASLPHCALMCGPLAGSACASGKRGAPRASLMLVLARLFGYSVVGAAVASLGGSLLAGVPLRWTEAALAVAMGTYLLWTALRILRLRHPQLVHLQVRKPAGRNISIPPWAVGAGTALLPCGALWSAYLVASVSGSALGGAATMLGFSLASAPALAAASGLGGWLHSLERPTATKLLSSAALAGALIMMWRAYAALGQMETSCCTG